MQKQYNPSINIICIKKTQTLSSYQIQDDKHIDGQHIMHACKYVDLLKLQQYKLSQNEYDANFPKKSANIVRLKLQSYNHILNER
jgi:alpha-L-arabinofuranosidase